MKIFYDRPTGNWHEVVNLSSDSSTCGVGDVVTPKAGDIVLQRFSGFLLSWYQAIPEGLGIVRAYTAMSSDYNTFTLG